jgi:putative ABC transport system permease protein
MLKHHIKIAIRNMIRGRGYSFLNIAGLGIGMGVFIIILLWARYQFTYDRFHENIDQLYWVPVWYQLGSEITPAIGSPPALGPALKADYPEIVNATRYCRLPRLVKYQENHFTETIKMVDPSFLEMFTFPLVKGDPRTALSDLHSIIITQKTARKYFGDEDPMGKILRIDNECDVTVTGVAQDMPTNSILWFDFLLPIGLADVLTRMDRTDTWYNCCFYTMVQLDKQADYRTVIEKIKNRIKQSKEDSNLEPYLFPFSKLHLHWISGEGGYIDTVKRFILIALLILGIAIINFVNLMTARSGKRAREVGLRKVVGASRRELIRQFFGESILHAMIAGIIGMLLVELFLTPFGRLMGESFSLDLFQDVTVIMGVIAIAIVTGILAGSYPALLLSGFMPVKTLKGAEGGEGKRLWPRRILVVCQFAVSLVLIISTLVIYQQHNYMENKDVGFDRENVVYLPMYGEVQHNFEPMKAKLLNSPFFISVTKSTHSPSGIYWNGEDWEWEGRDPNTNPLVTYLDVGDDYLTTLGMKMAEGDFFAPEISAGRADAVVINEAFAQTMGFESSVGRRLSQYGNDYVVLGVVKDFHFKPVDQTVGPLVMYFDPERANWKLFAKMDPQHTKEALDYLAAVWNDFGAGYPFEYHFLDDDFERFYYGERVTRDTLLYFAIVAIVISCMGLFGLVCFMAERRTKEIGIRKVLGATVSGIARLLSKEFVVLVLVANLIAAPVAYYLMANWLQNYPYRVDINAALFVIATALTLLIAIATVSYQAIRAALTNPVETLRYE